MTIGTGTFDDLMGRNEPQPIDRNPNVPCTICGDERSWDTWQEEYDEITPETVFRCPKCWNEAIEQARIERKRERNADITEWSE